MSTELLCMLNIKNLILITNHEIHMEMNTLSMYLLEVIKYFHINMNKRLIRYHKAMNVYMEYNHVTLHNHKAINYTYNYHKFMIYAQYLELRINMKT